MKHNNFDIDKFYDHFEAYNEHMFDIYQESLDWSVQGNCADANPTIMCPTSMAKQRAVAERYCTNCPAMLQCLYHGLVGEEYGVWGGTTEDDRRLIHRSIASDGFGNFKEEWSEQMQEYFYNLCKFLVKRIDEGKELSAKA